MSANNCQFCRSVVRAATWIYNYPETTPPGVPVVRSNSVALCDECKDNELQRLNNLWRGNPSPGFQFVRI